MIAAPATCGALVMVGFLMMNVVSDIDFSNPLDGIPAFMIIIGHSADLLHRYRYWPGLHHLHPYGCLHRQRLQGQAAYLAG